MIVIAEKEHLIFYVHSAYVVVSQGLLCYKVYTP